MLDRYWEGEEHLPAVLPDLAARTMIFERLGPDPSMEHGLESFDADLLPDLPFAQEVLPATERPADWEVVHVLRDAPPGSQRTLGFEVGYWGNSHFSPEGGRAAIERLGAALEGPGDQDADSTRRIG